jgi:hypothetical protein
MARHRPRAPEHVVSLRKVCEGWLCLRKERSKLVDQEKWLKETQLRVGLVSNSIFLIGDVEITWSVILNFGKQIFVSLSLIYLLLYSLVIFVLLCYILSCASLFGRYCVYLPLCISRSSLHIYSVN